MPFKNGVFGLIGGLLGVGLVYVVFLLIFGRLSEDPRLRSTAGLWRWQTGSQTRNSIQAPLNGARALWSRPSGTDRGFIGTTLAWLLYPLRLILGPLALIFGYLFLTVGFVLGSLMEWVVFKPILMGFLGAVAIVSRWIAPFFARVFTLVMVPPIWLTGQLLATLNRAYPAVIRGALAHPTVVVLGVVAALGGTYLASQGIHSELIPEVHQGEFTVEVALPVGTPLEETERIVSPIERAILTERQNIEALLLTIGYDSATSTRSDEGEHTAHFKVLLNEDSRGAEEEAAVIERLRSRFAEVPDLDTQVVRPVLFSQKTPIEVEVHGQDLRRLRDYGDRVQLEMASLGILADVETSLKPGAPEVQVIYDRDLLARYDLNIQSVAQLVRDKVKGNEATRFNLKDRRIPVLVQLDLADRESVENVRAMNINPGSERPIRLDSVAQVILGEGPSEVRRISARRVAVVSANIAEGSLSEATFRIQQALRSNIEWPSDMAFFITGQNEEWESSQRSLWVALGLSIFLVYVIMAAQFESLIHPLVIMFSIPLAFIGTLLALRVLGISLSIVVFLGMIMLAGIVVNNAIVLVDYINTLRARGMARNEAIVQAGTVRLRPILMTTATTVLGLVPMALGLGDGAEIRTPMAIAVISGLISSTALTLVVIPSFYMIADSFAAKVFGKRVETESLAASNTVTS